MASTKKPARGKNAAAEKKTTIRTGLPARAIALLDRSLETSAPDYPDTPAHRVIRAFKGPRALARRIGLDHSWVVRWRKEPPEGTGGLIPSKHHKKILNAAREDGLELTADDLIED